jgi:hypothetical protein
MTAEDIRQEVLSWLKNVPQNGCWIPTQGERGVVTGLMNSALRLNSDMGTANDRRRSVLAYLFRAVLNKPNATYLSAKEIPDNLWWCLCQWTSASKNPDTGAWIGKLGFEDDMVTCLNEMEKWQREMDKQLGFEV